MEKQVGALKEHYCPDWDYLLIGPEDPEWGCCLCKYCFVDEQLESNGDNKGQDDGK
jgi:hypothetical protein